MLMLPLIKKTLQKAESISLSQGLNQDIEILRSVAVLFILFHHFGYLIVGQEIYNTYTQHMGMYSGVDLFFCVSGFIISKSYYDHFDKPEKGILNEIIMFWIKRVFRLWPTAWLWLALMTGLFTYLGLSSFWANFADSLSAIFEVANFHWWSCLGSNENSVCGSIGNYWSLSLEEQFYMFFPLLFVLPFRFRKFAISSIILLQFFIPRHAWSHDLFWFVRTDALAFGMMIYLFSKTKIYEAVTPVFLENKLISVAALTLIIFSLAAIACPQGYPERAIIPFQTGMVALISAVLVFIASYNRNLIYNIPLLRSVLLWVGARSYGIYLFQAFAYQLIHHIKEQWFAIYNASEHAGRIIEGGGTIGLIILLAEINFYLVEKPFRKVGRNLAEAYASRCR